MYEGIINDILLDIKGKLGKYDPRADYAGSYNSAIYSGILSDAKTKTLQRLAYKDGLTADELMFVAENAGKYNDMDILDDDNEWDEDMLQGYAEHLRNYLYTYKDSAKLADPTIDTGEVHNGPMAQDIELVAPDCVKETDDGIKTVDGSRLALVNAGVIGDLVRKLNDIERRLSAGGL